MDGNYGQNQNWQNPNQNQPNQNWQNPNRNQNPYYNGYNSGQPNNGGLAVGSLVCGIISLLGFWSVITFFVAIVGVILGVVNIAQDNPNKGMAIAGIILSVLGFLLSIFFLVILMEI